MVGGTCFRMVGKICEIMLYLLMYLLHLLGRKNLYLYLLRFSDKEPKSELNLQKTD